MDDLKTTYNKIAKDWMLDHQSDTWWIPGLEKFVSYLTPGQTVLDAGCGAGEKSKFLLERGMRVTGVDFSESMINLAKANVPAGKFSVLDLNNLDDIEELFDGVLAQAVLLHFPKKNVKEIIQKLTSRLKPKGYLCIGVKEKRPGAPEEQIETEKDYGYEYSRFFSFYTLEEITGYLKDLGMEIVFSNVINSGKTNWIQVIGQKN